MLVTSQQWEWEVGLEGGSQEVAKPTASAAEGCFQILTPLAKLDAGSSLGPKNWNLWF
jgi:hypothetical protein